MDTPDHHTQCSGLHGSTSRSRGRVLISKEETEQTKPRHLLNRLLSTSVEMLLPADNDDPPFPDGGPLPPELIGDCCYHLWHIQEGNKVVKIPKTSRDKRHLRNEAKCYRRIEWAFRGAPSELTEHLSVSLKPGWSIYVL
jgi:hypothetical protein